MNAQPLPLATGFWSSIAANLMVIGGVGVLVITSWVTDARLFLAPAAAVVASATVGAAGLVVARWRRFGAGVMLGALAIAVILTVIACVALVSYFVLGHHELS